MHKKTPVIIYHFKDLKNITEDYSGFSFESANSILHHHEDFYEVTLITSGEWQHTMDNITTVFPIGTLLLFKPGVTHTISSDSSQNTHLVFGVEQHYFEEYLSRVFPDFEFDEFADYMAKPINAEKRKYIEYLACGVTNVVNTFQPDTVCIGGGISHEGETLLAPLRKIVEAERYSKYCERQTEICAATLGNDAGIIGAACLGR